MPLHKTEAVVIHTIKLGEADKIATLFTKELGKIKAVAKGARRIKSRFGSSLEPFTHINTTLFEKGNYNLLRIRQADIIQPFFHIREDFEKIIYGLYFLELIDKFLLERDVNKGIFSFLIDTLNHLNNNDELKRLFILFGIKFLKLSGYQYRFDKCISCGDAPLILFFSAYKGGLICDSCAKNNRQGILPINKGTALYLSSIQKQEAVTEETADAMNEAVEIIKGIFADIIGRPLMSQEFINKVKG